MAGPEVSAGQVQRVVEALDSLKAVDVVVIPLAGKANFADYLVVATGTSTRHVASLGQVMREKVGDLVLGVEGLGDSDWVCVDLGAVVAHVFTAEKRSLYNLEKLWSYTFTDVDA